MVANLEWTAGVNRSPTQQIRDQPLRRETQRDAGDAAESEQACDGKAERLHHHQRADHHDRGGDGLSDGIRRRFVEIRSLRLRADMEILARKSTRLHSSHYCPSRMPSTA